MRRRGFAVAGMLLVALLAGCSGGSETGGTYEIAGGTSLPLNRAAAEVDAFRLQGLLEVASRTVESGFGPAEIERVMSLANALQPGGGVDQTFPSRFQGHMTLLEVKVRALEGQRFKVTFATSKEHAQALRPELESYAR
jgi:hypothetical protein